MRINTVLKKIKEVIRDFDDWIFEHRKKNYILFVLTNGLGFSSQAPVIKELIKIEGVIVYTTTDRDLSLQDIYFNSDSDRQIFFDNYVPYYKTLYSKWNIIVNTYSNSFFPKRNGLQVYMHHGPGFGASGTGLPNAQNHDIFFGLSSSEGEYFDKLKPGVFHKKRAFFPVGSPKTDALVNGNYSRDRVLSDLGLPDRPTILITSHWAKYSTLSVFLGQVFEKIAGSFEDYNIIQTGHPWLWTPNKNVNSEWAEQLRNILISVEQNHTNAFFSPSFPIEALLSITDLLVADNSSVITMYNLLDRPIVFFNSLEARRNKVGQDQVINLFIGASHTFSNISEIEQTCLDALKNPDEFADGRELLKNTFYANLGKSSSVAAKILSEIVGVYSTKSKRWSSVMELSRKMNKNNFD